MKISLRPAALPDIPFLWYLRNQPYVRAASRNKAPVSWKEHVMWAVPVVLGICDKILFLVEVEGVAVGQIRFDISKKEQAAEVSIAMLQEFQGRGFAKEALGKGLQRMRQRKVKRVVATVHRKNTTSQHLFEKLGFRRQSRQKGYWLVYEIVFA